MLVSGGWYEHSKIGIFQYDMDSCEIKETQMLKMDDKYFGEGLTRTDDDKVYQLTWMEKKVFVYRIKDEKLELIETKGMPKNNYIQQGWGMAFTKDLETKMPIFVVSDGSSKLKIIDVMTWRHIKVVPTSLNYINELEMIEESEENAGISNYVFANAFHSNSVHMIHIHTGEIVKKWDCTQLLRDQLSYVGDQYNLLAPIFNEDVLGSFPNFDDDQNQEVMYKHYASYDQGNNVLNGIAYQAKDDTFLLTGKMWNHIYKVRLDYKNYIGAKDEL
jgi:glutamine cyclotransferase